MLLAIGARSLRWLPAKVEAFLARMPDRPVADPLAGGRDAGRAALDGGGPGGETEPMRLSDHRVSRNPATLFGDMTGRMAVSPKEFQLSDAGFRPQIGRASCRERVCQHGWISVVVVSLKKKKQENNNT